VRDFPESSPTEEFSPLLDFGRWEKFLHVQQGGMLLLIFPFDMFKAAEA
jgi:hypothetical protein